MKLIPDYEYLPNPWSCCKRMISLRKLVDGRVSGELERYFDLFIVLYVISSILIVLVGI